MTPAAFPPGGDVPRNQSNVNAVEPTFGDPTVAQRARFLSDRPLFFKKFLAKGTAISSAVPSSRALVSGVLRNVDFAPPSTIVELGAGVGPVTEQILERLQPHHRFVAVENDHDFCEVLRRRFPDASVLET